MKSFRRASHWIKGWFLTNCAVAIICTVYIVGTVRSTMGRIVNNQNIILETIKESERRDVFMGKRLDDLSGRLTEIYENQQENVAKILELQTLISTRR